MAEAARHGAIPIVGGGSVGLLLGARLAGAGRPVRLHVRSEEAARTLRERGVEVEDPVTGARTQAAVDACSGAPEGVRGPVFVCVREPDTEVAAVTLAAASPEALPVNVQNGVEGDARLARRFRRVIGAVWRQTCTRVEAHRVRALGRGRMVLGAHPTGTGPDVEALAALLREAGFDVGVSARIGDDRWLKLCINSMSSPNALVRQDEHATVAFVAGKVRLLEEARAALEAAGIAARSCDGRDRSLEEEIAHQRAALARGDAARPIPLYNAAWRGLAHGLPLESDAHHRAIVALGRQHGVATPTHARVLAVLERVRDERRGPECLGAAELFGP